MRPGAQPREVGGQVRFLLALGLAGLTLASCVGTGLDSADPGRTTAVTFPASSIGPNRTVGPAMSETRAALVRVLGTRNLVLTDTQAPYRPPESAILTTAPRAVYQVILPQDPGQGFIVAYEFAAEAAAAAAATDQAAYLASGPARVQSSLGSRHVIRVFGRSVVTYSWDPDGARDPAAPGIQSALELLGSGVDIPS